MAIIERIETSKGKVRFRARIRIAGFPSKTATFDKMGDARSWASEVESDMRLARYLPDRVAAKHTVSEMIDRYLAEMEKASQNRPRYFAGKKSQLKWWKKAIGSYTLNQLRPQVITACRSRLLAQCTPATANRYQAALNHCLSVAVKEWCWLATNPLANVAKFKEPRGRMRFLSAEELPRLLAACRKVCADLYDVVVVAISTGARKNELLTLRHNDVDLTRGVVVAYQTKNGDPRPLFLTGAALAVVKRRHEARRPRDVYLFGSRNGQRPLYIDLRWNRARAMAGLKDFRFHDLRHTTASYMAMNGASTKDIAEVLGHKTLNMVQRYAHLCQSHTSAVVANMTKNVFGGLMGEGNVP